MPNHITNVLNINAYKHQGVPIGTIDELLAAVKGSDSAFDFNTLIPMPPELQITSGSVSSNALALTDNEEARKIQRYPWAAHCRTLDQLRALLREKYLESPQEGFATLDDYGARIRANIDRTGHPDWYSWCPQKWGTKWNAYDVVAGKVDDTEARITFDTAWAPPMPVLDALAAKFPTCTFRLIWCDEGSDTQHRVYWSAGKRDGEDHA